MAKHIDAATKQLFDLGPADWLAVAGLPLPPGSRLVTLDGDLSTVSVAPDKLIRVEAGAASFVAHVELQANADPAFDRRMLLYNAMARWRFGLPVWSVALLLRPEAGPPGVTGRVVDRAADDMSMVFAYRRVRVWELPVEPLLTGPLYTLPLAPLAAVTRADLPVVVDRVRRRLAAEPPPPFGGGNPPDLWQATLNLLVSRYPHPFLETLMLDLMNPPEGTALWELREKGRQEGRQEGRAESLREAVLWAGAKRFGPAPDDAAARLHAVADLDRLTRVFHRVDTATNWVELLAD